MNVLNWQIRLAIILLAIAGGFDLIHFYIFKDSEYIFKFILAQLGFLPISVLLVTIVVHQLLGRREKQIMLKKLNMVIGSFFSQVGIQLLRYFFGPAQLTPRIRPLLAVGNEWTAKDFEKARSLVAEYDFKITKEMIEWEGLRDFLLAEKGFMLGLLGNPNLLEHESFTELLWAVFHLTEELSSRKKINRLSDIDYDHLIGDIKRAYSRLLAEWLAYMKHLQSDYPYLFSLAVRMNPLNPQAAAEIK